MSSTKAYQWFILEITIHMQIDTLEPHMHLASVQMLFSLKQLTQQQFETQKEIGKEKC